MVLENQTIFDILKLPHGSLFKRQGWSGWYQIGSAQCNILHEDGTYFKMLDAEDYHAEDFIVKKTN